jgi:ParB family chromosome partitioning protein
MRMMDVDKLKPHPKNNYFFDDIEGEPWTAFLESIETSGVIEPIIVSAPDLTIVSGHQRVRACKTLGIKQVAVDERTFDSDDEILKQLIETNIRQRGIGNINFVKFGRCERELERIYGIKNGGDRTSGSRSSNGTSGQKTQKDLADESGVSLSTYKRSVQLADLPEEVQQMVMDGKVTASTASRVIARLSKEEQKQLAEQISGKDKVSNKEVEAEIAKLREENKRLKDDNKILARRSEPTVIEKTVEVEVVPDDYEEAKRDAEIARKDFNASQKRYEEMAEKWKASEREKERLLKEKNDPAVQEAERIKLNAMSLVAGVSNFLEKFGGYSFLMNEVNALPKNQRDAVNEAVNAMNNWVSAMLNETISEVVE